MSLAEGADTRPYLLMTGASGGLAVSLAHLLERNWRVVGVDPRPMPSHVHFPGDFYKVEYAQRKMAEIFRQYEFHSLLHLGRVRTSTFTSMAERFRANVYGTQNLISLAQKRGIKNLIVLSTFHVYGAMQINHAYITEDEPLRAAQGFPDLADAVEMDHAATTTLWKERGMRTVVLRPANIIGKNIRNNVCQMLRSGVIPKILGFDPLMQFIHEEDVAQALILALNGQKSGIFNVAGEGVIPWSKAIEVVGATAVPVPEVAAYTLLRLMQAMVPTIPTHLIDYYKFPTTISDEPFRREFPYAPSHTTMGALKSI